MQLFELIQKVLPKHLWIDGSYQIYHIDNPEYITINENNIQLIHTVSTGAILCYKRMGQINTMIHLQYIHKTVSLLEFLSSFLSKEELEMFQEQSKFTGQLWI